MEYQVGDQVIHWQYGLGEVIQLDEKVISGKSTRCYVVRIRDLTLWVPVEKSSLRLPTPKVEFDHLRAILRGPSEPLPADRFERKTQLLEKMKDGKLESICRVVRDLSSYRSEKKLNDNDVSILERAQYFLLSEWKLVLSVPLAQAEQEVKQILGTQSQ